MYFYFLLNGLKVKQLAKQPPRLKMLIQKILVGLIKNFYYFNFKFTEDFNEQFNKLINSLYFWNGILVFIVELDNPRKNRSFYTNEQASLSRCLTTLE